MSTSALSLALTLTLVGTAQYGTIQESEVKTLNESFQRWWETDFNWTYAELPKEGSVLDFRVPYCGHDYPDKTGGTQQAMNKYDYAFHQGRRMASEFERQDTAASRERQVRRGFVNRSRGRGLLGGLFRRRVVTVNRGNPNTWWYGHCNGWTAASIRHAEPRQSVTQNGVVFTPADIKGLLAEIYMYNDSEFLGGADYAINPGALHATLANWLGRGSHPIGMETALGDVVVNYPLHSYKSEHNRLNDSEVEVTNTITYAVNTDREVERGPRIDRTLRFHYILDLSDEGKIVGGRYYNDSSQIDMLWAPLNPAPGGSERNKRGNPHIDVKEVLAIWRASVPQELRSKWMNIDPPEEDQIDLEDRASSTAEEAGTEDAPPAPAPSS